MIRPETEFIAAWIMCGSALAWVFFGFDKWRATRGGRRVPELTLCLVCAAGGWPGGLLGMITFRHKTSKPCFILKFLCAGAVWTGAVAWLFTRA